MACTTILVGKEASFNGATMIARSEDDPNGSFTPKNFSVILPEQQPRLYHAVISHVTIELPDNPMRYTAMPNADPKKEGLWAASGVNAANVAMTATETISSNTRVLAADPYVEYVPANENQKEIIGGIGEEDIVTLVLPYINSAREGVLRLGRLLEQFGTYEPNGIAFCDADEVWYIETIGGHHWIARKLPDECYAVIANQFSLDFFDLQDALGTQENFMASKDMKEFIEDNHLDLSFGASFNARLAFGSHDDTDHIYNTPRVWYGQRFFNPSLKQDRDYTPEMDDMPWCRKPEFKITVDDVKNVLSSNYEGTPYNPYAHEPEAGRYRPIGINRSACTSLMEIRPNLPKDIAALQWISFGSNAYNTFVPQFTQVNTVPEYFHYTSDDIDTHSFYWTNRLIAALADPCHNSVISFLERYRETIGSQSRRLMEQTERACTRNDGKSVQTADLEAVNQEIADLTCKETQDLLAKVLYRSSMLMKNAYSLSDR